MQAGDYAYGAPGEFLFHYTRARTAFEHILPNNTIRLNPYRLMRDPLEAQHWPEATAYWDRAGEDEEQGWIEAARMIVVVQAKEAARLLCLTGDAEDYGDDVEPFGRGYARASMWELHGDDHLGVCLAFDRERLLDTLERELADRARIIAKPVTYVRTLARDSLPSEPPKDRSAEALNASVDDYLEKNADQLLFSKLLDWSGEQEFRFVAVMHDDHDGPLDVSFGDSLRAVIVGEKLPGWQRAGGEVICREAGGVDLVRCIWHDRQPKIVRDVRGWGEGRWSPPAPTSDAPLPPEAAG